MGRENGIRDFSSWKHWAAGFAGGLLMGSHGVPRGHGSAMGRRQRRAEPLPTMSPQGEGE